MGREATNADVTDGIRCRMNRALWGFVSGLDGWWKIEAASQDGTLKSFPPTKHGELWDWWLHRHPDATLCRVVPVREWSVDSQHCYRETHRLLDELFVELCADGSHMRGYIIVRGNGTRLFRSEKGCMQQTWFARG